MRSDQLAGETAVRAKPSSVTADTSKLNVFISYSRKDLEFADQIVAALDAFGFSTTIDRKGIHGAENWERRLGQLILEADVVVFVLTRASVESPVCRWEVDQALELKKRIIPVLVAPLGDARPHEHLQDLNYIHFYPEPSVPGSGFGSGLARLTAALSVDIEWTREHTRLSALTARWSEGRPTDLLVRGSELTRLQQWRDTRPANAPELTMLQRAFLQASEDAEIVRASEERKQLEDRRLALKQAEDAQQERAKVLKTLSKRTFFGLIVLSVLSILSVGAALFAYQQNQELQRAGVKLEKQEEYLQRTSSHLRQKDRALNYAEFRFNQKNLELQRTDLRLKQKEEELQSASARLEQQKKELQRASLRLKEGMTLKIAKMEHAVSATEKWYRIATDYKLAIGVYYGTESRSTPMPKGTGFLVKGESLREEWKDQVVFLTAAHVIQLPHEVGKPDFSETYLEFPGLDGARPLRFDKILFESKDLDVAVLRLSGAPPLHALPIELATRTQTKEVLDGVAVLHWTQQDNFSLGFGHMITDPPGHMVKHADQMFYTHVTGGGASGSPVFDASSGNVVCLHQGGIRNSPRPIGMCTSISTIMAAIAAK